MHTDYLNNRAIAAELSILSGESVGFVRALRVSGARPDSLFRETAWGYQRKDIADLSKDE
jgi:hypothetical protein